MATMDNSWLVDQMTQAGYKQDYTGYYWKGSQGYTPGGYYENVLQPEMQANVGKTLMDTFQQVMPTMAAPVQQGRDTSYDSVLKAMVTPGSGYNFTSDPSYQWRLNQGQQAVERSYAAKGLLGSGNVLTALTDYAQGAASQEYQAQFGRVMAGANLSLNEYNSAVHNLATIAGIGSTQQGMWQYQLGHNIQDSGQMFNQRQAKQTEQGLQDALTNYNDPLYNPMLQGLMSAGNSGYTPGYYNPDYTAPAVGHEGQYYNPQGYWYDAPTTPGYGSWSSSSGGSGTFGDNAPAPAYGYAGYAQDGGDNYSSGELVGTSGEYGTIGGYSGD